MERMNLIKGFILVVLPANLRVLGITVFLIAYLDFSV